MASLLEQPGRISAPLDAGFRPMVLGMAHYRKAVQAAPSHETVVIGLERNAGLINRMELQVLPSGSRYDDDTFRYVERVIKFMLWAYGGWRIFISGPAALCKRVSEAYCARGARAFDADLMARVYQKPFAVKVVSKEEVPAARQSTLMLGGHLDGCRIGFDLGASDYKLAAVKNGELVFATEIPWNPKDQPDPQYHYKAINDGLKQAASHLPRVDAIGGSSAGVIVDNEIMVASLFRAVPRDKFDSTVKPLFLNLRKEWNIPLEVINDGDVTALAGAMSLEKNAMLGIAMGSSEAGGYLDRHGRITGWLTELAFAPVDLNPAAAADEWSGDSGVGALYFSQQAVNKLAPAAGYKFPAEMGLPERLKAVQQKADAGDPMSLKVFETIGVYLGYTIPLYAEFYDYENLLILGRVTSGAGGDIILSKAREVLASEFPQTASRVALHVPDEKSRRVGQAFAAASLPEIQRKSV